MIDLNYSFIKGVKTIYRQTVIRVIIFTTIILFFLSLNIYANSTTKYGDLNEDGFIDVHDAVILKKYILNMELLSVEQIKAADLNGDNVIDEKDLILILKKILRIIDVSPVKKSSPTEKVYQEALSIEKDFIFTDR